MELDHNTLKQMIWDAVTLRENELDCGECFEELGRFAELCLVGKSAGQAMPLVRDHLERCTDCREEFEALLASLQAADGSFPND